MLLFLKRDIWQEACTDDVREKLMKTNPPNRSIIALAGVLMQVALDAVIAGAGLGLGYIVPIATLVKWFPDKRGTITGIAVAGFGAGALVTAPIAQRLIISVGVSTTFVILGIAYFVIIMVAATVMNNPPAGYAPAGFQPASVAAQRSETSRSP